MAISGHIVIVKMSLPEVISLLFALPDCIESRRLQINDVVKSCFFSTEWGMGLVGELLAEPTYLCLEE